MEQEQKYYLRDIETGFPYEVTKEQHDAFHNALNHLKMPDLPIGYKGVIQIFGTAGDLENTGNLEDIFYKPENYKLKDKSDNDGGSIKLSSNS